MKSIRRDKTATDPEGNGSTLTNDNLDPALGVPLLVRQNHAGNYTNSSACSQLHRCQDFAERPMWLDSRGSGKGDKEEPADVLGREGTKVTSMMPIMVKGKKTKTGWDLPHPPLTHGKASDGS